jgi:PAS domain-containing protein
VPKQERAFYTLDDQLRLLDAGPRALAIWGRPKRDLLGKRLVDLFPYIEGGPVHHALLDAVQTLRPVRLKTDSVVLSQTVEVEIYPVNGLLQVSFWPSRT